MKRKNVMILFSSIVIAMLGYGIAMPLFPFYIERLGGGGKQLGLLLASYGVMQLIFAPVWGSLSDRYGRKPILLIGMMGLSSSMILFGFSTKLWMLYVAQMLSGALSCAMFPVSMAYVSDISESQDRGGAMGKVGAAVGLGMILGPGFGGMLAGQSLSRPFFIAAAFCALTCFIILFGLPESLPRDKRPKTIEKIEFLQVKGVWQAMFTPMAFGLFTAFAVNFGKSNFSSVYGLYALEKFNYGPQEVGGILMVMSFVYLMAQGVLVGPLTKKFGEERVIKIALIGNSIGFILMLMANSYIFIVLSISFFILLNALLKPSALAFVSKNATISQGVAMGITESYMSLGRIIGPIWAGMIFDIDINYPFISGTVIFLLMFLISLSLGKRTIKSYEV